MQSKLFNLQLRFVLGGLLVSPLLPLIYFQGKKVLRYFEANPVVPPTGDTEGRLDSGLEQLNLLVVGESTVEGIGVENFEHSLSVKLAERLAQDSGKSIYWKAVGKSGVTAAYTLQNILPAIDTEQRWDLVVLVLGANDSFALTTPLAWSKQINAIVAHFKAAQPQASVYLASMPPVGSFPALPQPMRWVLGQCNKLLCKTSRLIAEHRRQFIFSKATFENQKHLLCPDGVHPSAEGYSQWADAIAAEVLPHLTTSHDGHLPQETTLDVQK